MAWISTFINYKKQVFFLFAGLVAVFTCFSQSIFQATDAPVNPLVNDGQPIITGVKFRATQNGYITGIRYYKGQGSTGNHIGQLWSGTGTLLASAGFANEKSLGWQEVSFSTPFAITAGSTYVAACYSPSGDYAISNSYFSQAVVNGPLRALANGEDGPNGVFIFAQEPVFPVNSYQASNYWVDIVFTTNVGPDKFPPVITSVSPANASENVNITTSVTATFNEAIDPATINNSTIELRNAFNELVQSSIIYSPATNSILLTPSTSLINSTNYSARIKGGSTGVKDVAGNALPVDYVWSFTTKDPPFISPNEGYGGPVLVVSSTSNPFSRYTAEILRAEGLNEFEVKDISTLSSGDLLKYDIIILGDITVTETQVDFLTHWVNDGGTLIAFKPGPGLSSLFGITPLNNALSDRYLLVNTSSGPGIGIVKEAIQFHGSADLYTIKEATSIADLYSDAKTATPNPAITTINVGTNGGKAIAFAYDLAKSIVYTRQGNPAWVGQKRDGQAGPIRSDDLFYPDWIDFDKIAIPQADEQQRLLVNIILQNNLHRKPLPRLWYLPKKLKAAIVMTGDDHGSNGTTGRFNHYLSLGPNTAQDVADWNAIRATSYIYPNTPMTNAQATAFAAKGFEIALHTTTNCENFTAASLENNFASQLSVFSSVFPGLSSPVSNRTHCMPWSDWSSHPGIESNHGMRIDVNYYYWPASWVQNHPGVFTGSALPMRFADMNGNLIDCYQAPTQMTDESGISIGNFCNELLSKATGPEGYYGVFTANMHTDSADHAGSEAIITTARQYKIPVISAQQLLKWTDGRNNTAFSSINWSNDQLSFIVNAPTGARNLDIMLPFNSGNGHLLSVSANGSKVIFDVEEIKGMQYAFVNAFTGSTQFIATYSQNLRVSMDPSSQSVCDESVVVFTSEAKGDPTPTVQWQESINGTSWSNINGAVNPTLSFTATQTSNNKKFRAVWSNSFSTVISNPATLTITQAPLLTSSSSPAAVTSGTIFTYDPTGDMSGTSFTWRRTSTPGISNPAAMGSGSINETLINTTNSPVVVNYIYTLTANNCARVQNVFVTVKPAPLAEGCTMTTAITANFNNSSIPSGRYIWFSSVFKAGNIPGRTVNFTITNSRITYILNNQLVTLNVPDAHIKFGPGSTTTTGFISNGWETNVPVTTNTNVFMTGLSYKVPTTIPGGLKNIKWEMNVQADQPGVSVDWKWTAGVYTNFASNGGLNIKPTDGLLSILNPLLGLANAGTPLNYTLNIVTGAMGAGLLNITNTYSSVSSLSCASGNSRMLSGQQKSATIPEADKLSLVGNSTIDEISGYSSTNVMPNPSTDHFNIIIRLDNAQTVTVRILDIAGRVAEKYEKVANGTVLQVGHRLNSGTYFAEISGNNERKIFKIIKVN